MTLATKLDVVGRHLLVERFEGRWRARAVGAD